MTKPTQRNVKIWMLGVMNRQGTFTGANGERDCDIAVKSSLMAFVERFPAVAFCSASMDAVCASEAYWNEAKIIKALDAWWRENSPDRGMALPIEAMEAPVSDEAKQWLAGWYRAKDDDHAARALDLIRAKNPEAFEYLVQKDFRASSMAVLRKWVAPSPSSLRVEWDDPDRIWLSFQKVKKGIQDTSSPIGVTMVGIAYKSLVTAVRIHAPQHLWLLDPKRLRDVDDPVDGPIVPAPSPIIAVSSGLFE